MNVVVPTNYLSFNRFCNFGLFFCNETYAVVPTFSKISN
ncbi:hypothetical protein LEP1GSC186_2020 [Leptospira noguchii serovar Autumnalis str. ZUN142]|uniref:Uncharacterized protein n=1 Tax=Leptospira noguchii serovar Autumnalis str. ZUN142 TaxID=1085540 RepID=M6UFG5_9LEPT|nr:hypothetical protein LEP1GSC186_2020 [Leptospira noguchii serovar Autumnalis str. ZUN142]